MPLPSEGVWFVVGRTALPRVLLGLAGRAELEYAGQSYALCKGQLLLLPAVVGECLCRPDGAVSVLEISVPEPSVFPVTSAAEPAVRTPGNLMSTRSYSS